MSAKQPSRKTKSAKSQEKKAAIKAERAKISAGKFLVKQANNISNPLEKFPSFNKYERNGLSCTLECKRVKDLDPETLEWAIELCTDNMKAMYQKSSGGWKAWEKREEMGEDAAWYLLAFDSTTAKPIAFSHFRFDMDFGDEVLYCYELQLETEYQQKGLGRFMMQVLELMAFSNQMRKVVLTVFKHNPAALDFYKKCRYDIDDTSPEDNFEENFDYFILSKANKMKPTQKTSL